MPRRLTRKLATWSRLGRGEYGEFKLQPSCGRLDRVPSQEDQVPAQRFQDDRRDPLPTRSCSGTLCSAVRRPEPAVLSVRQRREEPYLCDRRSEQCHGEPEEDGEFGRHRQGAC